MDNFYGVANEVVGQANTIKNIPVLLPQLEQVIIESKAKLNAYDNMINSLPDSDEVKGLAKNNYNEIAKRFDKFSKDLNYSKTQYNAVQKLSQPNPVTESVMKNFEGLSFNFIPSVTIAGISGILIATVTSLANTLSPEAKALDTQIELLDKYINKEITFEEYKTLSASITDKAQLNTNTVKQATGLDIPVVLISGAIIFGVWYFVKNTKFMKKLVGAK